MGNFGSYSSAQAELIQKSQQRIVQDFSASSQENCSNVVPLVNLLTWILLLLMEI
jgi:hypothetical protein